VIGKEIGPYRILEKIGEGGMGIVFRGIHTKLEQEVAIKALSPVLSNDPVMRARFINEAKIQAKLSHLNVVNILNYLEEDGNVFLVMEFIGGETLERRLLRREAAIPIEEAITISRQVLDALRFMHSKGIIHRDIKPSNIMITEDGRVKVTDFGIAKVMGEKGYTKTGVKIGTLWYMSPEVIKGQEATALSDIYSLGISLFQMVTGRVPFTGDSEYKIMKGHLEEKPPSPCEINSKVTREMGKVILCAIAKSPEQRYQSAKEFEEGLKAISVRPADAIVAPEPLRDKPWKIPSFHLKMPPFHMEKRNLVLVLVGLGIILLIILYLIFFVEKKPESGRIPLTQAPSSPPAINSSSSQSRIEEQPAKEAQQEEPPPRVASDKIVTPRGKKTKQHPLNVRNKSSSQSGIEESPGKEAKKIEPQGLASGEAETPPQEKETKQPKRNWTIRK
jgi:serine/threonine protein kinase